MYVFFTRLFVYLFICFFFSFIDSFSSSVIEVGLVEDIRWLSRNFLCCIFLVQIGDWDVRTRLWNPGRRDAWFGTREHEDVGLGDGDGDVGT